MHNFIFLQKGYAGKYGNGKFPTKNMQNHKWNHSSMKKTIIKF